MGKHKLMMPSDQMFLAPFRKSRDSNPVNSAGNQSACDQLYLHDESAQPQEHSDNDKSKPFVHNTTSTQFRAPRSSVFPPNYTLCIGNATTRKLQKSSTAALSTSCLFPPKEQDKKMAEVSVSRHRSESASDKDAKLVRRKKLCRREYENPHRKPSGRQINHAETAKSRPAFQSPGAKSLLILIEKTMKEISELRKRQRALCNNQLSHSIIDCSNDLPTLQHLPVQSDEKTSASENKVDETEE